MVVGKAVAQERCTSLTKAVKHPSALQDRSKEGYGMHLGNFVHAFPLQVQKLLYQVPIHKVAALCPCVLVLESSPLYMAEASNALDDSPQAILHT